MAHICWFNPTGCDQCKLDRAFSVVPLDNSAARNLRKTGDEEAYRRQIESEVAKEQAQAERTRSTVRQDETRNVTIEIPFEALMHLDQKTRNDLMCMSDRVAMSSNFGVGESCYREEVILKNRRGRITRSDEANALFTKLLWKR